MDPRLRLFGSLALIGASRRLPSFPESEFPAGSLIRELADASDASPEALSRVLLCGAGALFVCNLAGASPRVRGKRAGHSPAVPGRNARRVAGRRSGDGRDGRNFSGRAAAAAVGGACAS